MSIPADLEQHLSVLSEALAAERSQPGFHPGKEYRDVFRAYVSGVQAWARVKDLIDAPRVRETVRREILAELSDVLDELPPGTSARLRLALLETTEAA